MGESIGLSASGEPKFCSSHSAACSGFILYKANKDENEMKTKARYDKKNNDGK